MKSGFRWSGRVLGSLLSVAMAANIVNAQQQETSKGLIQRADPNIHGDETISPTAAAAIMRGSLPMNDAETAAKQAATRASEEYEQSAPASAALAEVGEAAPLAAVVGGHSFAGLNGGGKAGAIGPFSYIQMTQGSARIYNRNTHATVASASLTEMAEITPTTFFQPFSVDPQIIWDPSTNRFYYVMRSSWGHRSNGLSFGFSRTSNPTDFSRNNWCKYTLGLQSSVLTDLTLGDSHYFIVVGAHTQGGHLHGPIIYAISKPQAGTACPDGSSFKIGSGGILFDTNNNRVWAPVAANQVDSNTTGYVVARSGELPSNKLWFYSVKRDPSTGFPVVGRPRGLTVPTYDIPPDASLPTVSDRLDTGDGRPTQAVQAHNPNRGTKQPFWVQHTVKHPTRDLAAVRWYEIDPAPAKPVILRSGLIKNSTSHFYNAAISPDRRSDGATLQFGDSFVIHYNESGSASGISPRIVARSSFNGGPLSVPLIVRNAVGPFQGPNWSRYSQASPDPRPTASGRGQVWGTNQYSGDPSTSNSKLRTWIFAVQP
jgi:hypothetical protein